MAMLGRPQTLTEHLFAIDSCWRFMRRPPVAWLLLTCVLVSASANGEASEYYIVFNAAEAALDPPWSITPEGLEAMDLPTYAEGLRNPGQYIPLDNLSERQRMNAEMANRSTRYLEYQERIYTIGFVTPGGQAPNDTRISNGSSSNPLPTEPAVREDAAAQKIPISAGLAFVAVAFAALIRRHCR